MQNQLFLSHDSQDQAKASVIAKTIGRVTLGQISVWHSSDSSGVGGVRAGQVWLDEIRNRLKSSKAVVVLLTPSSVNRPWILFESGFGAAIEGCDIIPVCLGIDSTRQVPFPLAMYQSFQLSDYESLGRFISKLLANYHIPFDEEMVRPVLKEAVTQLSQATSGDANEPDPQAPPSISEAVADLKAYIDRRLMSVVDLPTNILTTSSNQHRYSVQIEISISARRSTKQFIEIDSDQSIQDVLDKVYFMIEGKVMARSYLEEWVLRDTKSGDHLVIREIQSRIPAQTVFDPGSVWAVVFLPKPYCATDELRSFQPHR